MLPVAVARSSCDSNAMRYALAVLWMRSCFHIMERMGQNQTWRIWFVQLSRWRHRGDVCGLRMRRVSLTASSGKAWCNGLVFVCLSVCLSVPSAYWRWLVTGQHSTRPAYISTRQLFILSDVKPLTATNHFVDHEFSCHFCIIYLIQYLLLRSRDAKYSDLCVCLFVCSLAYF